MMEKLRILMYSERMVEDNSINFILRNEYNDTFFVSNYETAETFLLNFVFHLIFIDYRDKDYYETFAEILFQRHVMSCIVIVNLQSEDPSKEMNKLSASSYPDTTLAFNSTINFSGNDWFEKDGVLTVGDWLMDTNLRQVTYNNQRIKLTLIQFNLLYCLARNKNKVITYDQIIDYVWRGEPNYNNAVKTHVSRLRKILSDVTGRDHIINEKGFGYRFSK